MHRSKEKRKRKRQGKSTGEAKISISHGDFLLF